MDGIKPIGKFLSPNCGIVKLEIVIVLVGIIEVIGCILDSNDEVKRVDQWGFEGCDCKDWEGDLD
jgi:hypothetical protein